EPRPRKPLPLHFIKRRGWSPQQDPPCVELRVGLQSRAEFSGLVPAQLVVEELRFRRQRWKQNSPLLQIQQARRRLPVRGRRLQRNFVVQPRNPCCRRHALLAENDLEVHRDGCPRRLAIQHHQSI